MQDRSVVRHNDVAHQAEAVIRKTPCAVADDKGSVYQKLHIADQALGVYDVGAARNFRRVKNLDIERRRG
jgi:hypothetical protein